MIEEELRIGNYIQYRNEPYLCQVKNLGNTGIQTYNEKGLLYGSDDVSDYNGIPLTEEWLIKFGFEKEHGYFLKSKMKFDINTIGKVRFHWSQKVTYVDYVHQLQNLYFALIGEELILKQDQ